MNEKNLLKKIGSFLWGLLEVVIIVYVIIITMFILFRNKFGYTQFDRFTFVTMQDETYEYIDGAKEGDLLIVKSTVNIDVGDVIYYYTNINNQYVVKSAPVESMTEGETTTLYVVDDGMGSTIASTKVLGKESALKSSWGYVIDILVSRFGFLFLVLLPIMIVFIYQIYEFIMVIKYEEVLEEEMTKLKKKKKKKVVKSSESKEENKESKNDVELL